MSYHYPNKYKQMTCEFNIQLIQVSNGKIPTIMREEEEDIPTWTRMPGQYLFKPISDPIKQIIDNTYPNL